MDSNIFGMDYTPIPFEELTMETLDEEVFKCAVAFLGSAVSDEKISIDTAALLESRFNILNKWKKEGKIDLSDVDAEEFKVDNSSWKTDKPCGYINDGGERQYGHLLYDLAHSEIGCLPIDIENPCAHLHFPAMENE